MFFIFLQDTLTRLYMKIFRYPFPTSASAIRLQNPPSRKDVLRVMNIEPWKGETNIA